MCAVTMATNQTMFLVTILLLMNIVISYLILVLHVWFVRVRGEGEHEL